MSSKIPQVAYIPSAEKTRNKFDLSNDNITTSDFFRIKPSRIIECCPRESFKLKTETLIRMSPLAVPTFGRVNHYMRWFWVPCRTLCRGWNEFIAQTPYYDVNGGGTQLLTKTPIFKNSDVVNLFINNATGSTPISQTLATVASSSQTPDIVATTSISGTQWNTYRLMLTRIGKAFVDTLQNLNYNINWSAQDESEMSALPLLAYMRVIADYYLNPQYVSQAQVFFSNINGENLITNIIQNFTVFLQFFPGYSNYDPDFFVSAWDNPIAPNEITFNPDITIEDVTVSGSNRSLVMNKNQSYPTDGTPVVYGDTNGSINRFPALLSDYILKSLRVVTNYAIRNNIAGYKFWDRLEAEYGSVMDYKEKGTSLYIDTDVTNIQVSPVVSQSDTQGAELGALGGYGLGASQMKEIEFDSKDEFGYLIAMSSIVPSIGYYQGTKRENSHITPLQFFRPDFDSLGVQAITIGELFSSQFCGDAFNSEVMQGSDVERNKVFGYTPRYSEYKVAQDTLSGDFRVYSKSSQNSVNSYHLLREVGNEFDFAIDGYANLFRHNFGFAKGENTQYDRIFANPDGGDSDHFILIHHHNVHAWRNMKSLAETIFDDEDLEHNKKVEVSYNGSQLN